MSGGDEAGGHDGHDGHEGQGHQGRASRGRRQPDQHGTGGPAQAQGHAHLRAVVTRLLLRVPHLLLGEPLLEVAGVAADLVPVAPVLHEARVSLLAARQAHLLGEDDPHGGGQPGQHGLQLLPHLQTGSHGQLAAGHLVVGQLAQHVLPEGLRGAGHHLLRSELVPADSPL